MRNLKIRTLSSASSGSGEENAEWEIALGDYGKEERIYTVNQTQS